MELVSYDDELGCWVESNFSSKSLPCSSLTPVSQISHQFGAVERNWRLTLSQRRILGCRGGTQFLESSSVKNLKRVVVLRLLLVAVTVKREFVCSQPPSSSSWQSLEISVLGQSEARVRRVFGYFGEFLVTKTKAKSTAWVWRLVGRGGESF